MPFEGEDALENLTRAKQLFVTPLFGKNLRSVSQTCFDSCTFLSAIGVHYLFPVQAETFNLVYDGCDVIAQASKTLHFVHCHLFLLS